MMKRPQRREPRPPDRSLYDHWVRLPILRRLFRLRRRLHIRLKNDPPFHRRGPFYMTGLAPIGGYPAEDSNSFTEWQRNFEAPTKLHPGGRRLRSLPPGVRRQRAAWAMKRGAENARKEGNHV